MNTNRQFRKAFKHKGNQLKQSFIHTPLLLMTNDEMGDEEIKGRNKQHHMLLKIGRCLNEGKQMNENTLMQSAMIVSAEFSSRV